jgi:hypothetical protein
VWVHLPRGAGGARSQRPPVSGYRDAVAAHHRRRAQAHDGGHHMRRLALTALAAAALLAPATSRAGFFIGGRLGYSIPGGDVKSGLSNKDVTSSQVPLQLDLGYAGLLDTIAVGAYGAIGFQQVGSQLKDQCSAAGATCDSKLYKVGAQANFHPLLGIWAGVFAGWEQQTTTASFAGQSGTLSLRGWETGVQGGWDFGLLGVKFGPYASWSTGKFQTAASSGGAAAASADLGSANHTWLTLGIRGVFGL